MRQPNLITREIQDLDKLYLVTQNFSEQFPDDKLLRLNLEQLTYRKKILLAELEQSLLANNQHSLQYIFKDSWGSLPVKTLTTNLSALSRLVDKNLYTATAGKKKHLPLYFNTVFSGSFGLQLSTAPEDKLIDQDYESAVGETIGTLEALTTTDKEELGGLLKQTFAHDAQLLNRFKGFFKTVALNGQEVEIRWASPVTATLQTVSIAPVKAEQLLVLFEQQETSTQEIELLGIVKGVSLIRYWLEFVRDLEGRDVIKAKFDKGLTDQVAPCLNRYVLAKFLVTTAFNEAKDEPEHTYELLTVQPTG